MGAKSDLWPHVNYPVLTFGASKQAGQFSGMTGRSLLSANWRSDFSRTYTKGRITRRSRSLQRNAVSAILIIIKLNSNPFSHFPPSHNTPLNTLFPYWCITLAWYPQRARHMTGCFNIHVTPWLLLSVVYSQNNYPMVTFICVKTHLHSHMKHHVTVLN